MCHWLTIAVAARASLAPLRVLGAKVEAVAFPVLPEAHTGLQRFLVTAAQCACDLFGRRRLDGLREALRAMACCEPVVLAHHCFGHPPRGGRELQPFTVQDVEAFVAAEPDGSGRWVRLRAAFEPGGPMPARVGVVLPVAFAALTAGEADGALVLVLGTIEHVPGVTLLRCTRDWDVLQTDWHASEAEARAAAPGVSWSALGG